MSSPQSIGAFLGNLSVIGVLFVAYVAALGVQSTVALARRAVSGSSRPSVEQSGDPV